MERPASAMLTSGLRSESTRLLAAAVGLGVIGALAALVFDGVVHVGNVLLLEGLAGYLEPSPGMLHPGLSIPAFPGRWLLPLVTTAGGLISGIIVYRFAPAAAGHGTDAAIAGYHQAPDVPPLRLPLVKAIASGAILGSGGVAGREGPAAQIASAVGAWLIARAGFRRRQRRVLMLAAMAAGLAAVFRAPLGMALFAVEILYSGMVFESEALIFTIIASVTSYAVHGIYVGWAPIFVVPAGLGLGNALELPGYVVLGIASGVLGAILPAAFYHAHDAFARLSIPRPFKPALGGLMLGLMALAVPQVLGAGYGWVELALAGELAAGTIVLLLLLKIPAMAMTVGSGGSGGIFGPTVVVGAMLGALVGMGLNALMPSLGFSVPAFIIVGMAAVFAGAARTPISTLIMVAEMTSGYALIVPTMIAVITAFLVQRALTADAKYPTLYRSQVEDREESPAHQGVLVRRAFELVDVGAVDSDEVTLPRLVSLLQLGEPIPVSAGGAARLVKVTLAAASPLCGRNVQETVGGVRGATAVAIVRHDEVLIPRGPSRLEEGDELVLVATPEAHRQLVELSRGDGILTAAPKEAR